MHEVAGSYALNALDPVELAIRGPPGLLRHLPGRGRRALRGRRRAVPARLATPPPGMRDSIMVAIQTIPQLPAEESGPRSGPAGGDQREPPGGGVAAGAVRTAGPRRALPETVGPEEPDRLRQPPASAARRGRPAPAAPPGPLPHRPGRCHAGPCGRARRCGLTPSSRTARPRSPRSARSKSSTRPPTSSSPSLSPSRAAAQPPSSSPRELNRALFIGTDLPDPGRDKRYQLWTMNGPEPKWVESPPASPGTPRSPTPPRAPAVRVFFSGDIAAADFLCVSVEPKDNLTDKPTVPPVGSEEVS